MISLLKTDADFRIVQAKLTMIVNAYIVRIVLLGLCYLKSYRRLDTYNQHALEEIATGVSEGENILFESSLHK